MVIRNEVKIDCNGEVREMTQEEETTYRLALESAPTGRTSVYPITGETERSVPL